MFSRMEVRDRQADAKWSLFLGRRGLGREAVRRQTAKAGAFMTFDAAPNIQRVIPGEGTSPVVTREAIVSGRCAMLKDRNVCHLPRLRSSGGHGMAFVAADTLAGSMVAVTEYRLKTVLGLQRTVVGCKRVANGARADLALGRVAGKAGAMRIDPRLDRLTRPGWRMP